MKYTLLFSLLFMGLDQLSKWFILVPLRLMHVNHIDVLPPYLTFQIGWNKGINFGLFADDSMILRYVLIMFTLGLCCILVYWSRRFVGIWPALLFGATIGGALGNMIDRIRFDAVLDFLNMSCCGIQNPYVFNLADIFVFAGLTGLMLTSDRFEKMRDLG